MVPGEFVLRNGETAAQSGIHEDVQRGAVDNSSWLSNVNIPTILDC